MPAHKQPFPRQIKNFRLKPWLSKLDVTRLARRLEEWSLRVMELERTPRKKPPSDFVHEVGYEVIQLLRRAIRLYTASSRKYSRIKRKRKGVK